MSDTEASPNFKEYRDRYPARLPDLTNKVNEDEMRMISPEEGLKFLPLAPANDIAIGTLPSARRESEDSKYLWAVTPGNVPFALECGKRVNLSRGYLAHTNLTGGDQAHSAGEMWFTNENAVVINGGSSRYCPRSIEELKDIALCIKASGYKAGYMDFDEGAGRFARFIRGEPIWV